MKKNVLLTLAMLLLLTSVTAQNVAEQVISEGKSVQSIDVATGVDVYVHRATSESSSEIVLFSEDGDFDCLEYSFSGGDFEIKYTEEYLRSRRAKDVKRYVHIYTTAFSYIEVSSSADVIVEDDFDLGSLDINASSSGDIVFKDALNVGGMLNVTASSSSEVIFGNLLVEGDVQIRTSSSADVASNGSFVITGSLGVTSSSSSDVSFAIVEVDNNVNITSSSSADVHMTSLVVDSGAMFLSSSSSSDISIDRGEVKNKVTHSQVSGSSGGSVDCVGVYLNRVEASASSGADIKVAPKGYMSVRSSSGGCVYYKPISGLEIDGIENLSRSGSVRKL